MTFALVANVSNQDPHRTGLCLTHDVHSPVNSLSVFEDLQTLRHDGVPMFL